VIRRLPLFCVAALACLGGIAATPTESRQSRGGVYVDLPARDAAECALACRNDQICLAWRFDTTELVGCALSAIVPSAAAADETSGVAERAQPFLALLSPADKRLALRRTQPSAKPQAFAALPVTKQKDRYGDELLGGPDTP
jgi:hypothetical protein